MLWIVVADAIEASFYAVKNNDELILVDKLTTPNVDPRALKTDVPGTGRSDFSGRAYALARRDEPIDAERERFAAMIAKRLDRAVEARETDAIALAMAPKVLGRVRHHLNHKTTALVTCTLRHRRVDARPDDVLAEVRALQAEMPHQLR